MVRIGSLDVSAAVTPAGTPTSSVLALYKLYAKIELTVKLTMANILIAKCLL